MSGLAAIAVSLPAETIAAGTQLTTEGTRSGQLYILESGRLSVTRGGVTLASIDQPGAIVGEMSVLLGTPHSATVRSETQVRVRVLNNALDRLVEHPELLLHIATVACARLNTTSALLVSLQNQASDQPREKALMQRILSSLTALPRGSRGNWVDHE